ncbi:hypothetical protein AAC387_Pa01g2035 [Persea americana]
MPKPSVDFCDEVVWSSSTLGDFSLKSTYRGTDQHIISSWCDLYWFKGRINKHCMTTWLALHNGLKTKDVLETKYIFHDSICVLCNCSLEICRHFLTAYIYSMNIWDSIVASFGTTAQREKPIVEQMGDFLSNCNHRNEDDITMAKLCVPALLGIFGVSITIGFSGINLVHGKLSSMTLKPRFVQEQITSILRSFPT